MKTKSKEFIQFYDENIDKIYRYVYFRVNSEEMAQDIASEAFLRCWKQMGEPPAFRNKALVKINNPRAFLYQIARNLITDYYRQKPKMEIALVSENFVLRETVDEKQDLLAQTMVNLEFEEAQTALAEIQPEQREAVILRYLNDMEISEIAEILAKSEGAVRLLIHRGLGALRKILKV